MEHRPRAAAGAAPSAAWHASPAGEVLRQTGSQREGLAPEEAQRRLEQHGPNTLPAAPGRGPMLRFLLQFHNVLIYALLASAATTAWLGHWVDTSVILGVVLINALIGFVQEGRAERALDAIRDMLSPHAQVMRGGQRLEVPAQSLVTGDMVFLASGDKVPADLRLIDIRNLQVDESVLTGESMPVQKQVAPTSADAELGDRHCMAYSGTLVTCGQGAGVVVATGAATEIGRISAMLEQVSTLSTPLLRKLAHFSRWLTAAILLGAGMVLLFGVLLRGYAPREMFLAAVGLAVAAIPEGLPAIMTIALAIGVQRMARRRAIVRRLPAVEALGSVTVICTDKTGTLTRNEMTVQSVLTAGAHLTVSGAGYAPHGGFALDGREASATAHPELSDIARVAILCNDASLASCNGAWQLAGDPTEGALLTLAMKAGLDAADERHGLPRTDAIPFESQHSFMATLHHDHEGHGYVFLKGAPERVLALCPLQRRGLRDEPLDAAAWSARMERLAASGMRLLALAMRREPDHRTELDFADVGAGGFTLLAVVAMADPPREEAVRAVAACRAAGIRVIMITGDHAATASAIGEQLALAGRIRTLNGAGIDALDDAQLRQAVLQTDVFARASPEHKLRLVEALQAGGAVVAMTGDGVNDAPALKRADVGVAMGCKGTEAAKEAAEIVLADDNFASIVAAVEEGRTAYDNIRKAIAFTLPTNGGEAGMLIVAILLGITLPVTAVQILWINMVTEVTLSLALVFEQAEGDIMRRPPRSPAEPLLSRWLAWRIVLVSALLVAGSMGLYLWELEHGATLETARTAAINTLVVGEIAYLFNCRHLGASVLGWRGLTGNRYVLLAVAALAVLQALMTYLPAMQAAFGTAPLQAGAWGRILLFGVALMLVVEAEKWLLRRTGMAAS
ncbi:cation-transporting P-type ATPase [Noviherbaspirillum soli]|uniref:cation-transporting P-type ATPase n=1 Tax=Noviherbaspirillum soli TaxID=1064518 RepID=UPI00188C5FB4|nr:cation-transporting P-type ATPase [Noviherbaspirillum soli]